MRQAKRRPMLNEAAPADPRNPENWGGPDPLPAGKVRPNYHSVWERLYGEQPLLPGTKKDRNGDNPLWFTQEMLQAAKEMEWVFHKVSGGLMARASSGERVGKSPDGDWSERLVIAYRDRYKPWAMAMKAHQYFAKQPVHALLIDLAMEDMTVNEAERRHGLWRGQGLKLIEYGLGMYATMAGWVRG